MRRLSLLLPEYRNGPDSLMFECRLGRNCAAVVAAGAARYPFLARIFNLMFDIPTFQRPSASLFIGARAR